MADQREAKKEMSDVERFSLGKTVPLTRLKGVNGNEFDIVGHGEMVSLANSKDSMKNTLFSKVGEGPGYNLNKIYENKGVITLEIEGSKGIGYFKSYHFQKYIGINK
jgi:hypothetical protein